MTEIEKFQVFAGLYSYNPDDGLFRHKRQTHGRNGAINIGDVAGALNGSGYVVLSRSGKLVRAHRLAWFMVHGEIPSETIDHINGVRSDNRIANLRPATRQQQSKNRRHIAAKRTSKLGVRGVSFRANRFEAKMSRIGGGGQYVLGRFMTLNEAKAAVDAEMKKLGITSQTQDFRHPRDRQSVGIS